MCSTIPIHPPLLIRHFVMLNLLHAAFYIYEEDMIKLFFDTTVPLTYIIYSFFYNFNFNSDSHAVNLND